MSNSYLTNAARVAAMGQNEGLELDEVVDALISAGDSKKDKQRQAQRENYARRAERAGNEAAALELLDSDELRTLGLDKYEDVIRGAEESDNQEIFTRFSQEELDKGRGESKEDKRLRKAAENIAREARYREGNFDDPDQEYATRREYRQNAKYPAQYDPQQDDYVVKKNGRIIRFKKAKGEDGRPVPGDYRPTRERDGVIKRRMVKYRPGETRERYDPRTREVRVHNSAPEPFYPGARNQEPYDGTVTGKSAWVDTYNQLSTYIDSGAITDPQKLQEAIALRQRIKTNIDPGYAKAQDYDRGVALVRQNREGLSEEEITKRTVRDLRELTADGGLVRPTVSSPVFGPASAPVSSTELQQIRQQAILKSIHNPESVEPAQGRRTPINMIAAESSIRADYSKKPNAQRRALNETIALRDSIINETTAGNFADETLGNLGEITIQSKGYKKNGKPDWIAETPITFDNPAEYPQAYRQYGPIPQDTWDNSSVYFDQRGGNPLAVQGLDITPLSANNPDYGQTLNAPQTKPQVSSLEDLMIARQFRTRESGIYPQADISGALSTFNNRLSRVRGIAPDLVGNANNLADVQNAVDTVLSLASEKNARLNTFGTSERSAAPGVMEVLGKMRYTNPEVDQFANALLQLELSRTSGVNSLAKSEFFGGTGNYMDNYPIGLGKQGQGRSVDLKAEAPAVSLGRDRMTFGETEQMSDYSVGDYLDRANQRVAPAFRTLTGENIEGTEQERRETLSDARMPFIGQVRGESVPIEGKRGNPNYRFNATGETDPIRIEAAVRDQARGRATKKNPRNLDREEQNIYNAQIVNARHYPDVVKVARAGPGGRVRNQASLKRNMDPMDTATQTTATQPANDPWVGRPATGSGFTNTSYQSALPYGVDSDGPRQRPEARGFKQRAAYASDDFKDYARNPKYQRGRRVGYAVAGGLTGIAGLDALIGGERNRREEEQYQ